MTIFQRIPILVDRCNRKILRFLVDFLLRFKNTSSCLHEAGYYEYLQRCQGCPEGHSSFWRTIILSKQWHAWEDEVHKRFHDYVVSNDKEKLKGVFDVDECRECGYIGKAHLQEFFKFIREQYHEQNT